MLINTRFHVIVFIKDIDKHSASWCLMAPYYLETAEYIKTRVKFMS